MSGLYAEDKAAQVAIAISFSILVLADVIGNTLVILIILTNKSMKSPLNLLLVNLAVADILVGVFLAPLFILNQFFTHPGGLAGKVLCNTLTGANITWVAQISSCFSLVAISIERYFAIMHPFSAKYRLSVTKVKRMVIVSWICALVYCVPLFFLKQYSRRNGMCIDYWPERDPELLQAYSYVWFAVIGIMPIIIMFIVYSRVIYTLWFKQQQAQGTQLAMLKTRKRVTKMVVIVSVVYAICILPNTILYLIEPHQFSVLLVSTIALVACNSAVNPFIYTLQSTTFRRHLIGLLRCRRIFRTRLDVQPESSATVRANDHETRVRLNTFTTGGLNEFGIQ